MRLSKLKYGKLEATLNGPLNVAEKLAERVHGVFETEDEEVEESSHKSVDDLERVVSISARSAILEAWQEVERAMARIVKQWDDSKRNLADIAGVEVALESTGAIRTDQAKLMMELRQIRNQVAHSYELHPTADQSRRYIELALGLVHQLYTGGNRHPD